MSGTQSGAHPIGMKCLLHDFTLDLFFKATSRVVLLYSFQVSPPGVVHINGTKFLLLYKCLILLFKAASAVVL